jgi:hypothetical protein
LSIRTSIECGNDDDKDENKFDVAEYDGNRFKIDGIDDDDDDDDDDNSGNISSNSLI